MNSSSLKLVGNKQRIKKNGKAPLYIQVIIDNVKKTFPLNIDWPLDLIDQKNGCILSNGKKDPDYNDYQIIINSEISKVNDIFKMFRMGDRVLTMELFLKEYRTFENRKDFLVFMEHEIKKRYHEKTMKEQTYKNHTATLHKLQEFKPQLFYYEITSELLSKFSIFLNRKKGNNTGTVWGRIKDIKTYLNRAKKSGILFDQEYLNHPTGTTTSRMVYLEDDELQKLYHLFKQETLTPVPQQCLRAFLFQAFTSLRISDVYRANWAWVNPKNDMVFIPHKNERFQKSITVPLSNLAISLIQSKRGNFFELPAEQTINEKLKLIAEQCEIRKNITTHVGRHTFGTLFYRHTKDLITLSKIMGHAKIQQTMVYAHVNDQDKRLGMNLYEAAFNQL